jgi:hypothetical protein
VGVPKSAATAARGQPTRLVRRQVLQKLPCFAIKDLRAHRHSDRYVFSLAARTIGTFAMPATLSNVFGVIAKMKQSVEGTIRDYPNIATASAIAP